MRLSVRELEKETGISRYVLTVILCRSEFNKFYKKAKISGKGRASDTYEYNEIFKKTLLNVLLKRTNSVLYYKYAAKLKGEEQVSKEQLK